MTSDVRAQSRALNVGVWVASGLLCALYLFASSGKLMSGEFLGGIALLVPRLAFWAATGLCIIMLGAIYTHVSTNDAAHMWHAVVALVLLAFVAYFRRPQALLLS